MARVSSSSSSSHRIFPWLLIALFFTVFSIRVVLSLQADNFSGEEAYFTLRQIDSITNTGIPLYHDPLSFGGRDYVFAPFFYYVVSLFSMVFPPWFVGKILLNLSATSLLILIYGITKKITGDEHPALFSAFVGSFIPVFFVTTLNTFSIASFVFPLLFLIVYLYLSIEKQRSTFLFMGLFFLLSLTHYLGALFIVSWIIYLILLKVNDLSASRAEIEIGIFSIFLFLWTQLLIYKDALLQNGISVIWQNVPHHIFATYFKDISLSSALYFIGLIPLLYGAYAVFYHTFYTEKNKKITFLTSFALATFILLWLKFIKVELGLISLGTIMSILFSEFYLHIFDYLKKTRFAHHTKIIGVCLFFVVVSSSVLPSLVYARRSVHDALSPQELYGYIWLKNTTPEDSVVLSSPQEGHFVTALAHRKNVIDTNFLRIKDSDKIFEDVTTIYTTHYETEAIKLLNAYHVDYVLVTERMRATFPDDPAFIADERCFGTVFSNSAVTIYESKCKLA
ncbi:MAG: glycosyltransferase family 39 protein [Candidatus Woesearchaeota archaeon]|nr:glycosyltransferase family 39 protein [Candidatus Woesearchaeota archaeon]